MHNAIVTGASRGLGLGIARKLATNGYRVIAIARRPTEELSTAIAEVENAHLGELHFESFDLSSVAEIPGMIRVLRDRFGPLFALVNNAALGTSGILGLMNNQDIELAVRLNLLSPLILTKYVARSMMAHNSGRIVNVASIVGLTGYSGLSVYSATKASLLGFTRSLARELGPLGITVNSVAPGFIDTDMTKELPELQRNRVVRRSALRRLAEVDDVANAVEFLVSAKAKSVTGTVLVVDAGGTA